MSFADADDAPANRDIREGWFAFSGGRLTANLRLEQVDQQVETVGGSASFVMYYSVRDGAREVSATTDGQTWSFRYADDGGGGTSGPTTGAVRSGPNGVIEIEIPAVHAVEGETLRSVHARSFRRDPGGLTGSRTDGAPDGTDPSTFPYGASFTVGPCPTPPAQPQPQAEPVAAPGQPTSAPPHGGTSGTTTRRAPFTVTVPRLRARSLRRGRSFRVVVDPSAPVTALVVTLRRNGRVLARGRRASLARAGALRVRVGRRITKGRYRLTVTGRTSTGRTTTGAVAVRIL